MGAAGKIVSSNGFTGFTLGDNLFAERHESLLALPTGSLSGRADLHDAQGQTIATNVVLGPEKGNRLGNLAFISYETKILQAPLSESPTTGTKMEASLEYTPQLWKSDFKTMTGILSGKSYYEMHESHYLAMNGTLGLQMLNPLYQRTFQLGGSFGESPFTSVNKRLHPLRGLPTGLLRGEGIATGSLEYRFSIFRNMPGFGTAPLWFKNLHGALFFDGGQTFEWKHSTTLIEFYTTQMQRFGWNRFSLSSGLEIQSNVSLSYAPPLNFRLGYGQMLYLQGDWIGDRRTHQVYFSAGSSF
ncbi:MAG: surface antigen [Bacteriovoracaceae bacterium]|nr:surface antigen [Bacteriovoracaceae bacterium]